MGLLITCRRQSEADILTATCRRLSEAEKLGAGATLHVGSVMKGRLTYNKLALQARGNHLLLETSTVKRKVFALL